MRTCQNYINYEITGLPRVTLPSDLNTETVLAKILGSPLKKRGLGLGDTTPEERAALLWLLAHYCTEDRRGTTHHALLPIRPGGGDAALGQVILQYDDQLNGTATLAGRGLPLGGPALNITFKGLSDTLINNYMLAGISGRWTTEELTKLYHALALVPLDDRQALWGVQVDRVETLVADEQKAHTQGRFEHSVGSASADLGTLTLTDAAFGSDDQGFYGGSDTSIARPPSVQVILHEVGHAVESLVRRSESRNIAERALRSLNYGFAPNSPLSTEAITDACQLRYQTLNGAFDAVKLAEDTYRLAASKGSEARQKITQCENLGGKMKDFAQAARIMLDDQTSTSAFDLLNELQTEYTTLSDWYKSAKDMIRGRFDADQYTRMTDAMRGKLDHEPWLIYRYELHRWADLQSRMSAWDDKYVKSKGVVTGREQALVDFVEGLNDNFTIHLTQYTTNFFSKDKSYGELYAEAFSLWLVHPEALGSHSPRLLEYFESGDYRRGD
ncbi:hypothetical protein AB0F17_07205 [Nonomuraea sp. NPDC026600]|uniref:hypothetical protein n=1 Tax=Nonomuraea sp. NPDC026600 TaxID=3155363 RepID=UPI0033F772AE